MNFYDSNIGWKLWELIEKHTADNDIVVYVLLNSNKRKGNVIFSENPDLIWEIGNTVHFTLGNLRRYKDCKFPKFDKNWNKIYDENGLYLEESVLDLMFPKQGLFSYSINYLDFALGLVNAGTNPVGNYFRLFKAIIPKGSKYYCKKQPEGYIDYCSESLTLVEEIEFS